MSIAITATALTQAVAGGTVAVTFKVADPASRSLNLSYRYRLHGKADWLTPTTTLPETVAATPAGVTLNGTWDLNNDDNTAEVGATFDFEIIAAAPVAVPSTGTIQIAASGMNDTTGVRDGDTVTVGGRVYEFNTNGTIVDGDVGVTVAAGANQAVATAALITAIDADTAAVVTATANATPGKVDLTYAIGGIIGNIAVTKASVNGAAIAVTGLTGGLDAESQTQAATVVATTTQGIAIPDAAPGHDTPLPPSPVDPENVQHETLTILALEGKIDRYGAIAQGHMNWSVAKGLLNDLESGKHWVIQIFRDRNDAEPRAMLVTPEIYADLVGSNEPTLISKDVPWFINTAWRNLTSMFRGQTAYQITSTVISSLGPVAHRKTVTSRVVAYLVSYEDWKRYLG